MITCYIKRFITWFDIKFQTGESKRQKLLIDGLKAVRDVNYE